ncbi:MAG TPA: NAD-dependent epimerase/dehydratase family protein [Gaiellaceae bacterium]
MASTQRTTLVAGAGGFVGGHLVARLLADGATVRAVDVRALEDWQQRFDDAENLQLDLREADACAEAAAGIDDVYNLAADMGGVGYLTANPARAMLSVLINTNLLRACHEHGARRYFYASSACVYPISRQTSAAVSPLAEDDVLPALPDGGYGWEKLFGEQLCLAFSADLGLPTRIARLHNAYGPWGTFRGGREKSPAAICRKVAEAELSGRHEIEIWGDGEQTRSFMFVDDCVEGIERIMESDVEHPLNLGTSELVTINELVDLVEEAARITLARRYDTSAPVGVRGRNSDNTLIRARLGWEPGTPLREGIAETYAWVRGRVATAMALS